MTDKFPSFFLGFYCETSGLANYTNACQAGAYCPTGSFVPAPVTCSSGFHCPVGSHKPKPCTSGFYTNATGQSVCDICPGGFYCVPLMWRENILVNESIGYKKCPRGYYCPQQTGSNWKPCPVGTFSNQSGLHEVAQCIACPGGQFCAGDILTRPSGECSAGYYCTIGKVYSVNKMLLEISIGVRKREQCLKFDIID